MKRSLHPAAAPSRYSQKQRNGFVNQASTAFKDWIAAETLAAPRKSMSRRNEDYSDVPKLDGAAQTTSIITKSVAQAGGRPNDAVPIFIQCPTMIVLT